jgi:hypothetical protein
MARGGIPEAGAVMRAAGRAFMPPELHAHQRMYEHLAVGEIAAAAALLRAVDASGTETMYRWRALARAALEVEIAVAAGVPEIGQDRYRYLLPFAGELVLIGGAVAILPPVDLYLGLAAVLVGDAGAARRHFADAAAVADRMGARGYAARARVELAALTLAAPAPVDPAEVTGARRLAADAAEVADELGHDAVRERAVALPATPGSATGVAVFRLVGDVWTLSYDGVTAQLPDAKGLHDLARLLAAPHREIAARELAGDPTPDSGADEVLDERAKAAYKARLADLDAEIDEAAEHHDDGRLARATAERDALVASLAQAYGLGHRPRRLGDPGERARTAVTARIRDSIRRIDRVHPALAAHLRASVETGRSCTYRPAAPIRWTT